MRRLAAGLVVAALAAASPAAAQPVGRPARVGYLCFARCEGPSLDAFRDGLRELGWVEPRTLVLELRAGGGQVDRLPALARELAGLKPDVLVAGGPQPVRAARDAAGTIPLVFVAVADPVRAGLVQSLSRPGGTVSGVATLVPGGFIGKQVELLKEIVPGASRLAALILKAARTLGLTIPQTVILRATEVIE